MTNKYLTAAIAATIMLMTAPVFAQDYPVTIAHAYGETVFNEAPERVVTFSKNEQDFVLAFDVQPIGVRRWYGDQPFEVWPWAQEALGDAQPVVMDGDINYEQIASLEPDLIIGLRDRLTEEEYNLLSNIAPTVIQAEEYFENNIPWQEHTRISGRIFGQSEKAEEMIAELEGRISSIANAHPEWEGKTLTVINPYIENPHVYSPARSYTQFFGQLGFVTPPQIVEMSEGVNDVYFSQEDLSPIEADVVLWYVWDGDVSGLKSFVLRPTLDSVKEGREVVLGEILSGALSFSSPLSIALILDVIEAELVAAVDGDPSTIVPSAQEYGLLD